MKKYIFFFVAFVASLLSMTSCISNGIDDRELFDGADITGLNGIYYRWIDSSVTNTGSGEPAVKQVTLQRGITIDAENLTVSLRCKAPSNFPASQAGKLSTSNLVVVLNISTASIIRPIDGSAKLGVPADWSKPNKYLVRAANGTEKIWTVTMELLK